MAQCQLCKREFAQLKFTTEHIKVCTRCVNSLNEFSEPAIHAQNRLGEMLARGMERNALRDLESSDDRSRRKARWTLDNFDAAYQRALRGWLNRLLANEDNTTRDFKTVRAQRRGLLRFDGDRPWTYPSNWKEVATSIRRRDGYACKLCGERDSELHVHHIIYLSNFGTNQQSNLVTLCRACHEKEHDHAFDFGEQDDPESRNPLEPKPELAAALIQQKPASAEVFSPAPTPAPRTRPVALPPEDHSQAESRLCPRCGGVCSGGFVVPAGCVLRCTNCGFIPRLQIYDYHFTKRASEDGPCEGALVLEQVETKASQVPLASDKNPPHSELPEQPMAPSQDHRETVPHKEEQLDRRILMMDAVLVGLVVILVVAIAMH